MERLDRLIELDTQGLASEGVGPEAEWCPVPRLVFQRRHTDFWDLVLCILQTEPGTLEDLPEHLTEIGSDQLMAND